MAVHTQLPILIAGGGLGGLCAALAIANRGYSVRVLERSPEIKEIGAGVQLGPNVFRVLDALGLATKVLQRAVLPDRLVMMDSLSGQIVTSITVGDAFRSRFGYPYALIHRGDLLRTFCSACSTCPTIQIQTSQRVVEYVDRGDHVIARCDDGREHVGAALVGADGIASVIRAQLVGDGPARRSGYVAYRTVLDVDAMPGNLRANTMTLWAGPQHHLVHYPLRGHRQFNVVAAFRSDDVTEEWDAHGDAKDLARNFGASIPDIKTMLTKIDTWRMWVLRDRAPIKDWSSGRVTLLGDAAHPMLQYLGQGAGMTIEDALLLAEEVETADEDYASAFSRYAARRYLRTGRAQLLSRLYGEFFHATGVSRDIRTEFLRERTDEDAHKSLAWLYDGPDLHTTAHRAVGAR